jgi:hypothetical protein
VRAGAARRAGREAGLPGWGSAGLLALNVAAIALLAAAVRRRRFYSAVP